MARPKIDTPEGLTRAIGAAAALGLFAALPSPSTELLSTAWNVFLVFQFVGLGALAWTSWFRDDLVVVTWLFVFVLAAVCFLKFGGVYVPLMLILWGAWRVVRFQRGDHLSRVLLMACAMAAGRGAMAQKGTVKSAPVEVQKTQEPLKPKTNPDFEAEIMSFPKPEDFPPPPQQKSTGPKLPKYLTGYVLHDIASCGDLDQIPWKFQKNQKKTRLLLKDKLRYMNQTSFADWSLFQVLDDKGFATFIFRRPTANGRFESLVLKDTVFNRVVDTKSGPKTVESQDLNTLINRPAIAFYSEDGSSITFSPSASGNSMLTFQQAPGTGRLLPPVFMRGSVCDRPEDEEDSDRQQKQSAQPPVQGTPKTPGS